MDTPDPLDGTVRRVRVLDGAAVVLVVAGVVAAAALWKNGDEPDPTRALTVGAPLWVAVAVLVGASTVAKTILNTAPEEVDASPPRVRD